MMKEKKVAPPICLNGRIYWVDTAKALGLFLVFWVHALNGCSPIGEHINKAINSFIMPMYFILSGYVVKPELKPFSVFVHNKFKRILLPALILYILTMPLFFLGKYSTMSPSDAWSHVFYLHGRCAYNMAIWFFFCMFQLLIVAKLLDLSNASTKKLMVISLISLILSYMIYKSGDYRKYLNVFGFDKIVLGLFFYSVGMLLRKIKYVNKSMFVSIIAFPIWILFGMVLNRRVSMYGMGLGIFWYFIISGIAGSLVFFTFCKLFEKCEKIRLYAKWTIFIICSHFVFVSLFHVVANILSIKGTYTFDITSILFVLIVLVLYRHVCSIIGKWAPVLIGK